MKKKTNASLTQISNGAAPNVATLLHVFSTKSWSLHVTRHVKTAKLRAERAVARRVIPVNGVMTTKTLHASINGHRHRHAQWGK